MKYFYNDKLNQMVGMDNTGVVYEFSTAGRILTQGAEEVRGGEILKESTPMKRTYKKRDKKEKEEKGEKKKRATIKCKNCGEEGHQVRTCTQPAKDAEGALEQMKFVPITPDKLHNIKRLLKEGVSNINIADELGIPMERIVNMRQQLGL